ncbi:MAG TPA: hypothetical protein PKX48_03445 [Planctomycetota bacterium]|jgi:hypothetical protein|nr:hypothetical protein [Planctomycetota bacterium]OQC20558.1 MAG: hypothetical protein BWX69_01754 [Planctomycetes bacterium ADurb.Bin069]NMD36934.1 hypothetical protein [Planctomycetota bacterium]HNR97916.1 hypothetical protein [Planctomycetota bacterium]HNU24558.1 hypothetical protein [Planctomycetota bacterium]
MRAESSGLLRACLSLCLAGIAGAATTPIEFLPLSNEASPRAGTGLGSSRLLKTLAAKPSGAWKLPKLSPQALYALVDIGSVSRLMVIDSTTGGGFDRLYFDDNADKILREPPREGKTSGGTSVFPAIECKIKLGSKLMPYCFRIEVEDLRQARGQFVAHNVFIHVVSACCWSGIAEVAGEKRRVFLSDANVNGFFGDKPGKVRVMVKDSSQLIADRLFMAPEDKKLPTDAGWILGDILVIEDGCYKFNADLVRGEMALSASTVATGPVEVPTGIDRLSLSDERGQTWIMVASPSEKTRLPLGKWRLVDYEITRSESGYIWSVHGTPPPGESILYVGKKERSLALGEPLQPTIDARKSGPSALLMMFKMLGVGKEDATISCVSLSTGVRSRPGAPKYRIEDDKGEVLAEGVFQYG